MDMVDMTTCKFVGDASLNNDSFIHCDLLTFANINNGANLQLPLDRQNKKVFRFRGASPTPPPGGRGGSLLDPRWGDPVIGSRSALAMKFEPCAVLN